MTVIHKCDACNRTIVADRTVVDVANHAERFEFCVKCAAPIHAVLKKHKLTPVV